MCFLGEKITKPALLHLLEACGNFAAVGLGLEQDELLFCRARLGLVDGGAVLLYCTFLMFQIT